MAGGIYGLAQAVEQQVDGTWPTFWSDGHLYTFTTTPASINEGVAGSFTVTTTTVDDGTTLYWTVNNITTANADFSEVSGSFIVTGNIGTFNVTPIRDYTTEGAQTFTVSVRTESITGPARATSAVVTANDTSLDPTYAITTTPASINEGANGTFGVTTTDVPDSTTLYWSINNVTTAAADFSIRFVCCNSK
jgi:hypothetical protein